MSATDVDQLGVSSKGQRLFPRQFVVLTLLLVASLLGWATTAWGGEQYVELHLTEAGAQVSLQQQPLFFAPYVVEPGETFESISTKFYGSTEMVKYLAGALGVPEAYIPPAGSIAYIVTGALIFRFAPESAARDRQTAQQFLGRLPKGTRLTYQWATGNPTLKLTETGKSVLTRFDVSGMLLTPAGAQGPTLELKFPLRPLLTLIRRPETLEGVSVR
jgi:hypothetical protein